MSNAAERSDTPNPEWARLERAAKAAAAGLVERERLYRNARETIAELSAALDELKADRTDVEEVRAEVDQLRVDNAALRGRMGQARKRIAGLMQRLSALKLEP